MTPTISVLIPCYRQARFLRETVASIQDQTLSTWEVIIVVQDIDSASTADSLAHQDERIRVIEQDPIGVAAARNTAAHAARGLWILPLDADDMLDLNYLERLSAAIAPEKYAIAYSDVRIFGSAIGEWCPTYSAAYMREQNCLPNTALHTRALWEDAGGWEEALIHYEDWAYWIRCSHLAPVVTHVADKLLLHRHWGGNVSAGFGPWHNVWKAMIRILYSDIYPPSIQDRLTLSNEGRPLLQALREKRDRYPAHEGLQEWLDLIEGRRTVQDAPTRVMRVALPPAPARPVDDRASHLRYRVPVGKPLAAPARGARRSGPTFPSITAESHSPSWHMLAHQAPVPEVRPLDARMRRIEVLRDAGAQHNPCVFEDEAGLRVIVRSLHGTETVNFIADVGPGWVLENARRMTTRATDQSLEDLRVFRWNDRLWAVAATHGGISTTMSIRQALLELNGDGDEVLRVHVQPSTRQEKNWMPCVERDELRLVYATDPVVTLRATVEADGRVDTLPRADATPQMTSHVRGGSQLIPWEDGYLAVVHQVHKPPRTPPAHNHMLSSFWPPVLKDPIAGVTPVIYLHHFVKFNRELTRSELSAPFYFTRVGIEFCCGLVVLGSKLVLSFGVADCEAWLAEVQVDAVRALFNESLT